MARTIKNPVRANTGWLRTWNPKNWKIEASVQQLEDEGISVPPSLKVKTVDPWSQDVCIPFYKTKKKGYRSRVSIRHLDQSSSDEN